MAPGSTQILTEISAKINSLGGKGGRCVWMTALQPSCADFLNILGASTFYSPQGLSKTVQDLIYRLLHYT